MTLGQTELGNIWSGSLCMLTSPCGSTFLLFHGLADQGLEAVPAGQPWGRRWRLLRDFGGGGAWEEAGVRGCGEWEAPSQSHSAGQTSRGRCLGKDAA